MRFGKFKMFLFVNSFVFVVLLFHFFPWLFSDTTTGGIVPPSQSNAIHVTYRVDGKDFSGSFMRNDVDYLQRSVNIRYLVFRPQTARVNSFMGFWAEPLAWWSVFLAASGMLFLTNNTVFSKGTIFRLHKKFPWISMEEYFPWNHPVYTTDDEVSNERTTHSKKENIKLPSSKNISY